MPLKFHPQQAMLLICDFNSGFQTPEMIKTRPVVIISPRPRQKKQLCTVVPLSTTEPNPIEPYHYLLSPESLPGKYAKQDTWAKCDMLATISLARLDRLYLGKDSNGKRLYVSEKIIKKDFIAIQQGVILALGLSV
jgi:mRNA interferase MazF